MDDAEWARICHELANMLTVLTGNLPMLRAELLSPLGREVLKDCEDATKRMVALVPKPGKLAR